MKDLDYVNLKIYCPNQVTQVERGAINNYLKTKAIKQVGHR